MTRLYSSTVLGVDGVEVEVEVDFRPMAEKRTFIVGLPDAAVKESGQRVDTAIQNSGLPFQQGIFVVNLAPADLRKQGPGFDLPIVAPETEPLECGRRRTALRLVRRSSQGSCGFFNVLLQLVFKKSTAFHLKIKSALFSY